MAYPALDFVEKRSDIFSTGFVSGKYDIADFDCTHRLFHRVSPGFFLEPGSSIGSHEDTARYGHLFFWSRLEKMYPAFSQFD